MPYTITGLHALDVADTIVVLGELLHFIWLVPVVVRLVVRVHLGADHRCIAGNSYAKADIRLTQDLLFLGHEADRAPSCGLRDRQADRSAPRYGAVCYGGGGFALRCVHYYVLGDVRAELRLCVSDGGPTTLMAKSIAGTLTVSLRGSFW